MSGLIRERNRLAGTLVAIPAFPLEGKVLDELPAGTGKAVSWSVLVPVCDAGFLNKNKFLLHPVPLCRLHR